jgi:hypothetical protein
VSHVHVQVSESINILLLLRRAWAALDNIVVVKRTKTIVVEVDSKVGI